MSEQEPENHGAAEVSRRKLVFDWRVWFLVVAALIGIVVFAVKDKEAFPEASIDLRLSKGQIKAMALDCARKVGFHKDKLITSTTFSWDNPAKTYLELDMGGAQANQLMRDTVPIWYWRTRLCKEFDPEQFIAYLSPVGKLVCFQTAWENDKAIPSLTRPQAQKLAEDFISKQADLSLPDYSLIESSSSQLVHRTDHSFTWEDRKHPIKDAHLRLTVNVSGNAVSMYYRYLNVPEAWQRKFQTIRSYNNILARVAFFFNSFLYLAAAFIVIWAVSFRNARWRFAIIAGLLCAVGSALLAVNNLPDYIDGYSPRTSYKAFLVSYVIKVLGVCLSGGVFASMLVMAGEFMYRAGYPARVAFEHMGNLKTLSLPQTTRGLIVGLAVFGIALGWVVTYYVIGSHFGFWCPLDTSNYQVIGSFSPAYSALCIGVEAAFNEEILYRVIGLSLAKRLVKNRFWLANLLQAAAWGFAHSTYPQQPAYARGVELTLSGLVFGWVMNRFGLLPCLVAHFMLDAFLTAQPLFASNQPLLIGSGALPLLPIPILALLSIARVRRTANEADELTMLNSSIEAPPVEPHQPEPHLPLEYSPLSKRTRWIAAVATVACTAVLVFVGPLKRIGSDYSVNINRKQAERRAWDILEQHKIQPNVVRLSQSDSHALKTPSHTTSAWRVAAWLTDTVSSQEMQYLYEHVGLGKTIELARFTQPQYFWRVRFFKPMQAEEYEVDLDGNGNEIDFDTNLPEDAAGANLSEDEARAVAESYLKRVHGAYFPFVYESAAKAQRKSRSDYTFTFTVPREKVADAESKLTLSVIGNNVSEFSQGWSLPDKWKWEREKHTWKDEVSSNAHTGLYIVLLLASLWWLIGLLRVGYLPLRAALLFGAAMAALYIPSESNGMADLFKSQVYRTTMELSTFYFNQGIQIFESLLTHFGQFGFTLLVALPCARLLAPGLSPLTLCAATFAPREAEEREAHRHIWLDAVLISYGTIAFLALCDFIIGQIRIAISPAVQEASLESICSMLNTFFPSLNVIVEAITSGIGILIIAPICAGLYAKYCRGVWMYLLFALVCSAISASGQRYWQDFLLDCVWNMVVALVGWLFVAKFAKFNMLTYLMFGVVASLVATLSPITEHAAKLLSLESSTILVLLSLPVLYLLYLCRSFQANASTEIVPAGDIPDQASSYPPAA